MVDKGLEPDFSRDVLSELESIRSAAPVGVGGVRDLRDRLWVSIDNDDSRDLDQLTLSESLPDGRIRIYVAIADVDALVSKGSAIDAHARTNTTSVYTPAEIFPMLPEKLSTDLTSLNEGQERLAVVAEMDFEKDGALARSGLYRAAVHNKAKLAYDSVAVGLEGGAMPRKAEETPGVPEQLRVQDEVAQALRTRRQEEGALDLETIEPRAVFDADDAVVDLAVQLKNRARQLIEDFMIAANGVTARFLAGRGIASLRRVVRSPERWGKIVALAAETGHRLPAEPDARALELFLVARRRADPLRFPDLSLVVIKLMGAGEYVVERPGQAPIGHFGLAVRDYTHSTAPNRRYPDLITQRLVKAALAGEPPAYDAGGALVTRRTLHRAGGRRRQGRAAGEEVRRRAPPRTTHGRSLRRRRHGRVGEGDLGPHLPAARRRQARPRLGRPRSRRPPARQARSRPTSSEASSTSCGSGRVPVRMTGGIHDVDANDRSGSAPDRCRGGR